MTPADASSPRYAPFGLDADPAASSLISSTVETELGSVRVHSSMTRSGSTATLLLHGAAGSWTTWTPLLAAARATGAPLADVVAIDLPGWGDSPGPRIRSRLTLDSLADVVWRVVTHLGYTRADIVGHSLGAFIALHLAATRPASVDAVRLVSATSYSVLASIEHPVRSFGAVPGFTLLLGVFRLLRMGGDRGAGLVRAVRRVGLLRVAVSPLFRHPRLVPRSVVSALADEVRPDSFVRAAEATRGYGLQRRWASIRCPVWAVRGDADSFVPSRDLTGLLRAIPLATLAEIGDCGHFAHIERPGETLDALGLMPSRPRPAHDEAAAR
ncbi:alpha/beta hydrolase [Agreia sp. VKM Ac-1783]|uniref:alpha/beta fold hydrolase n=1 Tax=Agreia sp. VKM Ac-1783 TaxID=1938889 RepID=UPI000A2AC513|nr:alpha/beta hydrolase [Agreia sp. VKM Ac-1783]SMQ63471.1 Pimeloyl-ACP methyl ester carboxylesterase [Agreia sp. VKM Ac-1783]